LPAKTHGERAGETDSESDQEIFPITNTQDVFASGEESDFTVLAEPPATVKKPRGKAGPKGKGRGMGNAPEGKVGAGWRQSKKDVSERQHYITNGVKAKLVISEGG
jgi:hypothetical protein